MQALYLLTKKIDYVPTINEDNNYFTINKKSTYQITLDASCLIILGRAEVQKKALYFIDAWGGSADLIIDSDIEVAVDTNRLLTIRNNYQYHAIQCSIIKLGKFA